MQVTICKTIDVEAKVDCDVDEFLDEFVREVEWVDADEQRQPFWRRLLGWLDVITRAQGRIPDGLIAQIPKHAREELSKRLRKEADRWALESGIPVADPPPAKPKKQRAGI